jgi:hypothetical protein
VSSLWTPEGEHKVERPAPTPAQPPAPPQGGPGGGAPSGGGGPRPEPVDKDDGGYDEAEIEEMRRQLLEAPVEVVVANHAYGLFELAALHLGSAPPNLDEARLAVDAFGAIVEGLEGRLGQAEPSLREALAQIRLAYVQISNSAGDMPGSS